MVCRQRIVGPGSFATDPADRLFLGNLFAYPIVVGSEPTLLTSASLQLIGLSVTGTPTSIDGVERAPGLQAHRCASRHPRSPLTFYSP